MTEILVLDPVEVADGRVEFDLTPYVNEAGPDFGDAGIEAYLADAERGQLPVDFRVPNRQVTIPLLITDRGDDTFVDVRRKLQAKTALFQRRGGWLKRETDEGPVYVDIVGATLKLGAGYHAAAGTVDHEGVLTLDCIPDWYGDEEELDAITITSAGEIAAVLEKDGTQAFIRGDFPARVRLVLDELEGEDQHGVFWAFRSRYYDDAATAAVVLDSADLTPLGVFNEETADPDASGGTALWQSGNVDEWSRVASLDLDGAALTHVGTYRVWARVRSGGPPFDIDHPCDARLVWGVGDLTNPTENDATRVVAGSEFVIVDLGTVRLDPAPIGTHGWRAEIQTRAVDESASFWLDKVWLQNLDESAGYATASPTGAGSSTLSGLDSFNDPDDLGDPLTGSTPDVGAAWSGAGDSSDFLFFDLDGFNQGVARSALSDADLETGRYARLGTADLAASMVRVNIRIGEEGGADEGRYGVFLRYQDTDNWLMACYEPTADVGGMPIVTTNAKLRLLKCVAGTVTTITETSTSSYPQSVWCQLILTAHATGLVTVHESYNVPVTSGGELAATATLKLSATDSDLAAGGALDSGGYGIYDAYTPAGARAAVGSIGTAFKNFYAEEAAPPDAVVYADATAELRTDGLYREIDSGYGYSLIPRRVGDLPRIPPSGLEGLPVELLLKLSRGDLDQLADTATTNARVTPFYRPSWLFLGET